MASVWERFVKPEYVFRPGQILRRLRWACGRRAGEIETVRLPWNLPVLVRPNDDDIGRQIWVMGVFDVCVTETLWRLIDRGDQVVDVGANFGYMTSIMAVRVGALGRVLAFEPNPEVFAELQQNIQTWRQAGQGADLAAHQIGLGARAGTATLVVPPADLQSRGQASIRSDGARWGDHIPISVRRLDEFVSSETPIGLVKLDVEGYEEQVLRGAEALLRRRRIRDLVFEEHRPYPSPASRLLESCGFTVFALGLRLWGLRVSPPEDARAHLRGFDSSSLLATLEPARALARLGGFGWKSLRGAN